MASQLKPEIGAVPDRVSAGELPPAWREFIRFCHELRFGEIECLSIQNGLPMLAEVTRRKVKFNGNP